MYYVRGFRYETINTIQNSVAYGCPTGGRGANLREGRPNLERADRRDGRYDCRRC